MYLTSRPLQCFASLFFSFLLPPSLPPLPVRICQNLMNCRITLYYVMAGRVTMIFSELLSCFKNFSFVFLLGIGKHIFFPSLNTFIIVLYKHQQRARPFHLYAFVNCILYVLSMEYNTEHRIIPVSKFSD